MNEEEITEVSNRILIDAIDSNNLLHTLQGISNKTTLKITSKKRETVE